MRHLFVSLLFWIAVVLTVPAVALDAFEEANRQFDTGDFKGAAAGYETILATQGPDATVFYNLGNSYQRLKQYGPAILAYERARLLGPRDPDLLANLALARKAAAAFEDSGRSPKLEVVIGYLSRNEWSWLVAGGALAFGALAMVAGMVKLPRNWLRPVMTGGAVLSALTIAAGATALHLRSDEDAHGVVLTDHASIRLSPFDTAESVGTAAAGQRIHLGKRSGGFRRVEGPHLRGWIAANDAKRVCE